MQSIMKPNYVNLYKMVNISPFIQDLHGVFLYFMSVGELGYVVFLWGIPHYYILRRVIKYFVIFVYD